MAVLNSDAALTYATKPNILVPGSDADADSMETAALTRNTDENPTVTLDAGDLTINSNDETTKYSIPHAGN